MDAPEAFEHRIAEALHADREAIHARIAKAAEAPGLHGARIRLEGDFCSRLERHARTHASEQRVDGFGREKARCAAADENADEPPAPNRRQQLLQIEQKPLDVFAFGQRTGALVRVEVAVRALAHAPRNVDIERERRQCGEAHLARFSEDLIHAVMLIASVARSRGD